MWASRAQMRTMRQVQTVIANVEKAEHALTDAYEKIGIREEIVKAYVQYRKAYKIEINKLIHVFVLNTTLLNRHMDEFMQIAADGHVKGMIDHDTIFIRDMKETVARTKEQVAHLIAVVSSFDNTTYSAQRMLDLASQAREAQYDFKKAVIDERALKRARQVIQKDVRVGYIEKRDDAAMQQMLEALKKDLDAESQGIGIILIMLQEIVAQLATQEQKIHDYQVREKYPEAWEKADLQAVKDLENEIHTWIGEEISKLRLFLGKSERIAV